MNDFWTQDELDLRRNKIEKEVITLLGSGSATKAEVRDRLKVEDSVFYAVWAEMLNLGKIFRSAGRGVKGNPFVYAQAPQSLPTNLHSEEARPKRGLVRDT